MKVEKKRTHKTQKIANRTGMATEYKFDNEIK